MSAIKVFGVELNTKQELNTELIDQLGVRLNDQEIDLSKTEFITPESLEAGSLIASTMLPAVVIE